MHMPSLNKFEKSIEKISEIFNEKIANNPYSKELRIIFNVGLQSEDLALFPNIRSASSCSDYIEKWIKCYVDATQNPPSKRKASPKGSCNDPALENIVYYATGEEKKQIKRMLVYHNLFMSAENIQGNLLEEYINNNIQKYGWVWCNGTVLQAIDFCSIDGSVLLQIKNKNNTENSSSSKVRKGTTIEKWYRLGSRKSNGKILPAYKWDILNDIINSHVITDIKPNCKMTEDNYQNFLKQIIKANSDIISEE